MVDREATGAPTPIETVPEAGYEPPRIEAVLGAESVQREAHYAGAVTRA